MKWRSPSSLTWLVFLGLAACANPFGSRTPPPAFNPSPPAASCARGDHGMSENEIGWVFCYPGTWKFLEKVQSVDTPPGLDTTFDITDASPPGQPDSGKYGFMIISTYDRGTSSTLAEWVKSSTPADLKLQPIRWGNATEAAYAPSTGTRYALTPHHVVALQVKAGKGNLDLEGEMGSRLSTWLFTD